MFDCFLEDSSQTLQNQIKNEHLRNILRNIYDYWGGQGVTLIQRSAQIDSMFVHWKNHVTCECCIVKSSRNTTNIYKQYYYNLLQEYYQCYQSFFFPTCAGMKFTTINPISLGQGNLETGDGDICWSISGLFLERVDG